MDLGHSVPTSGAKGIRVPCRPSRIPTVPGHGLFLDFSRCLIYFYSIPSMVGMRRSSSCFLIWLLCVTVIKQKFVFNQIKYYVGYFIPVVSLCSIIPTCKSIYRYYWFECIQLQMFTQSIFSFGMVKKEPEGFLFFGDLTCKGILLHWNFIP